MSKYSINFSKKNYFLLFHDYYDTVRNIKGIKRNSLCIKDYFLQESENSQEILVSRHLL